MKWGQELHSSGVWLLPMSLYQRAWLGKLNVEDCQHCSWCNKKQKAGKYCALDDDAQPIFEHLESSDILVLVMPVYFMRPSARMANFIDRLRLFMWGSLTKRILRNKVEVSAAVSWVRHGGVETAHLSHLMAFLALAAIMRNGRTT
jgi:multimeric flavodoxin WrbA